MFILEGIWRIKIVYFRGQLKYFIEKLKYFRRKLEEKTLF
jgi:hypothetical protein